jgi:HSP20 family protein
MANLLRRVGVDVPEPVRRFLEGDLDSWLRVEEYQEGDILVVKAEVPGIDPEQDVEITLTGNQLHLGVRREEKSEHKSRHGYRSEFRYGTFSRTVTLPQGVNEQDLRAIYSDGVLEVRIPIPEGPGSAPRKIPITRG